MALKPEIYNIADTYFRLLGITSGLDMKDPAHQVLLRRSLVDIKEILKMASGDEVLAKQKIIEVAKWAKSKQLDWALSTVIKRWFNANDSPEKTAPKEFDTEDEPRDQEKIDSNLNSLREVMKGIRRGR